VYAKIGQNSIVINTYPIAVALFSFHNSIVSTEKVDIVVNAPSIPVPTNIVISLEIISFVRAAMQIPSSSEPAAFTSKVAWGVPTHSLIVNRSNAPIEPPIATAM